MKKGYIIQEVKALNNEVTGKIKFTSFSGEYDKALAALTMQMLQGSWSRSTMFALFGLFLRDPEK